MAETHYLSFFPALCRVFLNGESLGKQRKTKGFLNWTTKTLTILSFVCYSISPKGGCDNEQNE